MTQRFLLQEGFKGKYTAEEYCVLHASTPRPPPPSPHPSRFDLDRAQNRGSLVDLFTLNRQARGQDHGALCSLIYSEDFCLNYCRSTRAARVNVRLGRPTETRVCREKAPRTRKPP